jgi:carboxypeptidase C (cathepsin A)
VNISHNPYSWSKFANLVFIDSFVGTGFSFSQNVYDTDYTDEFASYSSFEIIKALFMAHPNLNETSFYFASQNYGGHLLPQITLRLFNDVVSNPNLFVNFSGLILGNPMVSFSTSVGSQIETLWGQQLIPLSVW